MNSTSHATSVKSTDPLEAHGEPQATGLASTAVHRFLVAGERPTAAEWAAEVAEADAMKAHMDHSPLWNPTAAIDPDAYEGEGRGEPGEDLGPADPEDEWDGPDTWDDWTDADDFRVAVNDLDATPYEEGDRFTLTEYLELVRDHFAAVATESGAAALVAEALADLVNAAVILGRPSDAATFRARRDAYALQSSY